MDRDGLVLKVTVAGLLSEHNRRWAFLYRMMLDTIAAMSCYRDELLTAMAESPFRQMIVTFEKEGNVGR